MPSSPRLGHRVRRSLLRPNPTRGQSSSRHLVLGVEGATVSLRVQGRAQQLSASTFSRSLTNDRQFQPLRPEWCFMSLLLFAYRPLPSRYLVEASAPKTIAPREGGTGHGRPSRSATPNCFWPNVVRAASIVMMAGLGLTREADAADVNSSNNPLTQVVTIQIQDYISPYVNRVAGTGNEFQARGLIPFQLFDTDQLVRFTVPVDTIPEVPGSSTTGLSNFEMFDLTLIPTGIATFGVGPLLVAPTAGNSTLGTDKWQAGAAAVAVMPRKWGLFAQVLTYQHSFGGGAVMIEARRAS